MLAALVFSLMERRIRQRSESLHTPARGKPIKPTGREALQNMQYTTVIKVDALHRHLNIPSIFRKPFRTIMAACGFEDSIYTEVSARRSG